MSLAYSVLAAPPLPNIMVNKRLALYKLYKNACQLAHREWYQRQK